ncbi:MAG TPA: RNA polymerase sigma factor [Planctomycetota bacterium]|nr:RNA polymerase sigma factor [Planctomycetota bacterium]
MSTTCAQRILSDIKTGKLQIPVEAWEILDTYREGLHAQATAIVGNSVDAEDVVQETFREAIRQPEKLTKTASVGAWLRLINKANAVDLLRRRKTAKATLRGKAMNNGRAFTTGGMSAVEVRECVNDALASLPETMRKVVLLHYWKHQSCAKIAQTLAMPEGTVKWHLAQAAVKLEPKLGHLFDVQPERRGK